jgi:hydrogenase maturation protease
VSEPPRRLVVGVGNPDRGDDGVGRLVARLLRGRLPADVRIEEQAGGAAELIDLLQGVDHAIMVDAMVSGAPPGTIRRLDCGAGDVVPARSGASSHGFGVAEAVALATVLSCLPRTCVVYAIEAASFTLGGGMSPDVACSAQEAARLVVAELAAVSGR